MKTYPPPDEFRFWAGPYQPPKSRIGTTLHDEWLGDVRVDGKTESPIIWPGTTYNVGRHKGLIPILCGDLVRAVCEENELTIRHYWGVTQYVIDCWKKAISGVEDSAHVFSALSMKRQDAAFRRRYYPQSR